MKKTKDKTKKHHISKLNILSIIAVIVFSIFLYFLFSINILPTQYLILIILVVSILIILSIVFINLKKKVVKVIGVVLIIISIILSGVGSYYLYYGNEFLNESFSNVKKEISTYYIVTNKENKYKKKDIKGTIYYYKNSSNIKKALKEVESEFSIKSSSYDNVTTMVSDVLNKDIDFMLIDKASYDVLLNVNDSLDKDSFKIVYEFDIATDVEKKEEEEKKSSFNIYIAGRDFDGLIDYNTIVTVNMNTHEILMTSIPRDYYMNISGMNGKKDSLSHMYAFGLDKAEKSVADFFEVPIDYNIHITTESLVELVDKVGGITYCSDQSFTTTHALILNSYDDRGKKKLYVKKGCQELNGIETLTVARERNAFVGRDRVRQKNCQKIIIAIFEKLKSTNSFVNYKEILDSLSNLYTTTIPRSVITDIAKDTIDGADWKFITQSVDGSDLWDADIAILNGKGYAMQPNMNDVVNARNKINEILEKE